MGTDKGSLLDSNEPVLCGLRDVGGGAADKPVMVGPPGRAEDNRSCGRTDKEGEPGVEFDLFLVVVGDEGGDGLGSGVTIFGAGRSERWRGVVDWRRVAPGGTST